MNCKLIGLEECTILVHQMHIFENSYIKPHNNVSDLEASFISSFAKNKKVKKIIVVFLKPFI
jgi:hypothetical protein